MPTLAQIRSLRNNGDHEAALKLAAELAPREAGNAELQYEAACLHDQLGLETAAIPYYRAAIGAGLSGDQLRGAYLGLGSTYRALGQYESALATFDAGLAAFPAANELKVFRAMALYNLGRAKEAVAALVTVAAESSGDPAVQRYRRALALYAEDLDRRWQQ